MSKEPYINLNDFMMKLKANIVKSQVSEERLVLLSDVEKAAAEARRIEA